MPPDANDRAMMISVMLDTVKTIAAASAHCAARPTQKISNQYSNRLKAVPNRYAMVRDQRCQNERPMRFPARHQR